MKKILLFLVVFVVISFLTLQFIALPKAKNDIKNYFTSIGFKNTEINKATFSIEGLNIKNITLDKGKFNTASNINVNIFWPSYLFNSKIKSISIETFKISSIINTPKDILAYKYFFNADKIKKIEGQNIKIKKILWDIATPKNALRIEGDLNVEKDSDAQKIMATLNAKQHELTFNSEWKGNINSDGKFNIEGIYNGFNINTNALKLNRATGWITLDKQLGQELETKNIAAQLDAGGGNLFNVPIKNISLILNQNNDSYPVLLRAETTGINGVELYGDFKFSPNVEKQAFELLFKMENPNQFINYLTQENILKNNSPSTNHFTKETSIHLAYKPENRFADGPFPFSVNVKKENKNTLNGTLLLYPNNLDIRGTAQGDKNTTSLLQTLFVINSNNISDKNIRLDTNLKKLF